MGLRPSTRDLEIAVEAMGTLRRRGRKEWTTDHFQALTRVSARFSAGDMLAFQERCGLLERRGDAWRLSEDGEGILDQIVDARWGGLGSAVLASGLYDDELSRLIEAGTVTDGRLICPLARLPRVAPVAGAILAWQVEHRREADLVVPLTELDAVLSLSAMEQAVDVPAWVEANQSVGWRAELYSIRNEIARHGANQVLHVSRDVGDGFGYDIERTASDPSRLIEVKGSRSAKVSFVITAKELDVARENPARYEIQFWGEISLGRPAKEEYLALLADGYPIVIDRVASRIESGDWPVEAQSWRVAASDLGRAHVGKAPHR